MLKGFFVLPWDRLLRVHKLLLLYNILLAQCCVLLLFWSAFSPDEGMGSCGGASRSVLMLWAVVANFLVTVGVASCCSSAFLKAVTPSPLAKLHNGAVLSPLQVARESVREKARIEEQQQGWSLVFRQTAPARWPGSDVHRRACYSYLYLLHLYLLLIPSLVANTFTCYDPL